MMNHPTYTTYRQRVSSLCLFENVYVKLLPPTWVSTESTVGSGGKQEKELKNILKLFSESIDRGAIAGSQSSSCPGPGSLWVRENHFRIFACVHRWFACVGGGLVQARFGIVPRVGSIPG